MHPDYDLSRHAIAAADALLATLDLDAVPLSGDADGVAKVLAGFAAQDLLDFGFTDPANTGPQPGDMAKACEVIGALAERSGTLAAIYMVSGLLGPLCLSYAGTAKQKAALLPRATRGQLQLAFALTEPGAGSDAAAITTLASLEGAHYVLRGEKTYITGAASADLILTVARSSPDDPRAFGIFLVPANAPGLVVTPLDKLAGNAYPSCHLAFDGVTVAAGDVLGGTEGAARAWPVLRQTGQLERLVVAALACGLAREATRRARTFISERHQFGQPLKAFQAIQHAVVEMSTLTTGMQLFLDRALAEQESGAEATQAICMAKYVCAEQLQQVVALAARVMGGRAYFDFEPVSRLYREAPFCLYAGGTVEVQKMLIARTLGI